MIIECVGVPGVGKSFFVKHALSRYSHIETPPSHPARRMAFRFFGSHPLFVLRWCAVMVYECLRAKRFQLIRFKSANFIHTSARLAHAEKVSREGGIVLLDEGMLQRLLSLYESYQSSECFEKWINRMSFVDTVLSLKSDSVVENKLSLHRVRLGAEYISAMQKVLKDNHAALVQALSNTGKPVGTCNSRASSGSSDACDVVLELLLTSSRP